MTRKYFKVKNIPDSESIRRVRGYLCEYSVFRKLWEARITEGAGFGNPRGYNSKRKNEKIYGDMTEPMLRVKMFEIRRFILSLPYCDERVFLFLRYVHGETMEVCAEKLGVSVRTVYRLHKRALMIATLHFQKYIDMQSSSICYE